MLRILVLWLCSFNDSVLAKEVNGKQVCYKFNFTASSASGYPNNVDVFCHFTNAANNSVQSPSMKLNLVTGESTLNYFKMLHSWAGIRLFIHSRIHSFNNYMLNTLMWRPFSQAWEIWKEWSRVFRSQAWGRARCDKKRYHRGFLVV